MPSSTNAPNTSTKSTITDQSQIFPTNSPHRRLAVLGLVICEELYNRFPDYLEGEMTRIKSVVVSRDACSRVATDIGLMEHVSLGKGITGAAQLPTSLAACAYEACVGALGLGG